MSYADLAAFKRYVRIDDTADDVELQAALDTATSAISHLCSRTFEPKLVAAETRYFQPWWDSRMGRWVLPTDDLVDTTGFTAKTWDATASDWIDPIAFDGSPWRPFLNGNPDRCYTELILPNGTRIGQISLGEQMSMYGGWQSDQNGDYVAVSALWGWPAVPEPIVAATLLQASRWFKRRDAVFGLTSSPDGSENTRLLATVDVDVQVAVRPFVKYWGAR